MVYCAYLHFIMNYRLIFWGNHSYSWFQTFAVFWMLYSFFWRPNFTCQRFRTLCLFHLHRWGGVSLHCLWRWNRQHLKFRCWGITQKKEDYCSYIAKIFKILKNITIISTRCKNRDTCRYLFKNLKILPFQSQYIPSLLLFLVTTEINLN